MEVHMSQTGEDSRTHSKHEVSEEHEKMMNLRTSLDTIRRALAVARALYSLFHRITLWDLLGPLVGPCADNPNRRISLQVQRSVAKPPPWSQAHIVRATGKGFVAFLGCFLAPSKTSCFVVFDFGLKKL